MLFGLSNASSSFQSLMNRVFQKQLHKSVVVFFDDILVYSPSWSTRLLHLEEILQLLQHHRLFNKLSKCSFGLTKVNYLGHTISGSGIEMDISKVQAVLKWPEPSTIRASEVFWDSLGITDDSLKGMLPLHFLQLNCSRKMGFTGMHLPLLHFRN